MSQEEFFGWGVLILILLFIGGLLFLWLRAMYYEKVSPPWEWL